MKVRNGFVSNSSSSSFVVGISDNINIDDIVNKVLEKNQMTRDGCECLDKLTERITNIMNNGSFSEGYDREDYLYEESDDDYDYDDDEEDYLEPKKGIKGDINSIFIDVYILMSATNSVRISCIQTGADEGSTVMFIKRSKLQSIVEKINP